MQKKVELSAKETANRINRMSKVLKQAVDDRTEFLQQKCQQIATEKGDVLSNQFVEVERLRKELHFAQLHAKDAISNHTLEEILSVKKAIRLRLKWAMKMYQQESMEPIEDDTINASLLIEHIIEEIEKIGSFSNVPDPSKCTVEGLAVPLAGVGKERKMAVVLQDETGTPINGSVYIQHNVRKMGEDPDEYIPPKVNVIQSNKKNGTATLCFTPPEPGEYEVTIMIRGKPVADPYKITARQPRDYSSFNSMQSNYKGVDGKCYGVAVDSNGSVYATNYSGHTVKVFRPDGTECQIGNSNKAGGELSYPCGIAILDKTMYVASSDNHMIKMYSLNGGYIGGFGGYGTGDGQFYSPRSCCTDGKGRVLIADQYNKRIQIFSSKGQFIQTFPCSSNHIAVYSRDGSQIETYNLGGNLKYPTGIYIDGEGNRFIASNGSDYVHIADSKGTLICSRNVNYAYKATTDKNGTVYVAEVSNKRISLY